MVQFVDGALLFAASLGVSIMLTYESKRRIQNIEAVIRLIEFIKRNIDSFLTPLNGIYTEYSCDVLERCGFSEEMKTQGLKSAVECGYLHLPEKMDDAFLSFAEKLGEGYRDEEVKRCEYYLGIFADLAEGEREKARKNRDLYRYIPPLGALSLLLVFM